MKKILVVDNHPVMLKFMSNLLTKKGHQVLTTEDGLSALDILKTYIPDVIFIDLVMPKISGDKLCRIIRNMPKLKDVYIVILSAIAAEEEVDFVELGANSCIAKGPLDKMGEHVLAALEQLDRVITRSSSEKVMGVEDIYQRQIIKDLLSSKRHFEAILRNMSEGILEITIEAYIIVYANQAAISLIGIPEEELLGSNFTESFCEADRKVIKNHLEAMGDTPWTTTEDSPVILNGKRVSINILPVKAEGHKAIFVILGDVSERRQIQAQPQQTRKMEDIPTSVRGIAHQFNNALFAVTGKIELLKMDLPDVENIDKYIEPIKASVSRMAKLTKQLMAKEGVKEVGDVKAARPSRKRDLVAGKRKP